MFKNYFKTAWRNIWKNKSFSFINILGLTAGTVCCLYILLYVKDQYGYDTYHKDAQSIYRIRTMIKGVGGEDFNSATASPPIVWGMKRDFPEVKTVTRVLNFSDGGDNLLNVPGSDQSFYEPRGYVVDSTFFQVFEYKFLEGTPNHSLDDPFTVILSSRVAKKLFGDKKALNQQINIGNRFGSNLFKITGVFDETYGKSHLKPNIILTMNSGGIGEFVRTNNQWAGQNFVHSYVKLNANTNASQLEAKLPAFLLKYGADNLRELGMKKTLYLQKMTDIHLHSAGISNQVDKVSNAKFLYLLLTIAFFIQLIACINFVNLTTARSIKRAREIGVRKVVGAVKGSLIGQFLGESVLIAFISILLAIPLMILLLPWLNTLTGGAITPAALQNGTVISIIIALGLGTGLLAGIYPAIYLSGFKPASVLKGTFSFKASNIILRKGLVVFQFVIAIVLIISVIIISKQIDYMQSQDLGFSPNQKIVVALQNEQSRSQFNTFKTDLMTLKDIKGVAGCNYYPSKAIMSDFLVYKKGENIDKAKLIRINRISEDFYKVLDIKMLAGRTLRNTDTSGQVVVNEKTLKVLNIPIDKAISAQIVTEFEGDRSEFEIVGVHADYNFRSLKDEIQPVMAFYNSQPSYMVVDVNTANYQSLLTSIESKWKKVLPGVPFEYTFLDQEVQKQYTEEKTLRKISNSFTLLAIIISCLGLFGLAMFTAQQRIKEIGVRKVLGASVTGIASMLSKDFLKLVLISIIIATPLAWWAMHTWLADFTYRTPLSWWVFVLAGIIAMLIAIITVSFQAVRAALANPVRSLRSE